MSVRQYVILDPPTINFRHYINVTIGTSSVVWQQQMEKAYIKTYKVVHTDRPDRYNEMDYTKDFETQFRPLQLIDDYNLKYIDPEYGKDPYWDDDLNDRENLHFRHDYYPPTDYEDDHEILDTKLSRALIELWQTNSEASHQESIEEHQEKQIYKAKNSLSDEKAFLHVLVTKEGEPAYIPLSTNLGLKFKRRMLYFSMDFGGLTLDGLIDTALGPLQCNTRSRPLKNTPPSARLNP